MSLQVPVRKCGLHRANSRHTRVSISDGAMQHILNCLLQAVWPAQPWEPCHLFSLISIYEYALFVSHHIRKFTPNSVDIN